MSDAATMKALGCWGAQNGLLSEGEIEELMRVVRTFPSATVSVLEVGHYYGLSTYALVRALTDHASDSWSLTTVDAHIADKWVPATDPSGFFANKVNHFNDPRVNVMIANSEAIQRIDGYNVVFYDGDHADEQRRFTELVMASPSVRLFIFDDRDFPVPAECCDMLRAAGWRDASPQCVRIAGNDKQDPRTMTLGIYWRPNAH